MGKPLIYEILEKPATTAIIAINTLIWIYIQKHGITYANVGLSYPAFIDGHHWRLLTSAFSHISPIHLVFNMSALWSLGAAEQLLGLRFYLHYTLLLALFSGLLNVSVYHLLIHKFGFHYFRNVTAVGYSCVVFGWMTVLAVKQPDARLNLFGVLSLPISFAPFESLVFTSIIVPQASFVGHLSGIVVGYLIGWGVIDGMDDYWAVSILGWVVVAVVYSLKRTGTVDFPWIEIESVAEEELPMVGVVGGNGRRLQIGSDIV